MLDNDDSFRVVSCLYKLFGSRLQIGHIQIRTGTTTPLVQPFLVTKWYSLPIIIIHLCDPAGTRTRDPYIKSVLLCQLSYETFPYNLNQVPLFSFRRTNRRFTRFFLSDLTFPTGRIGYIFQILQWCRLTLDLHLSRRNCVNQLDSISTSTSNWRYIKDNHNRLCSDYIISHESSSRQFYTW